MVNFIFFAYNEGAVVFHSPCCCCSWKLCVGDRFFSAFTILFQFEFHHCVRIMND
jgi:hypothetical protein